MEVGMNLPSLVRSLTSSSANAGKTVTLGLRKNATKRPPIKPRPVKAIPGRTVDKIERVVGARLLSPLTERQKLFVRETS
jgi:hypothetical protein